MNQHDIKLKTPDSPPWKWWALFGVIVVASVAYWISSRSWQIALNPEEVPHAEEVSPRPGGSYVAVDQPKRTTSSSPVISVEAAAELKSTLYPNAITNYFEEVPPEAAEHPLDPALAVARMGLERLQSIRDYTTTIVKRERIKGELGRSEQMSCKIRRPLAAGGQAAVPFSVYLKFLQPKAVAGREVLWVENRDGNKMLVREAGFLGVVSSMLDPEGSLAMSGSRYPIWEIGFDVLIARMIEKGERDRKQGICNVTINRWVELQGRPCTQIVIEHPEFNAAYDFHRAEIVIDDELNIPVHYSAYLWPPTEGASPQLIEQYTYKDVQLDVGLTDTDFSRKNPEYGF